MKAIEINKMTKIERLQTMEALGDSLVHEPSEIESPEWHRGVLEERKRRIEEGKAEFISVDELRAKKGK